MATVSATAWIDWTNGVRPGGIIPSAGMQGIVAGSSIQAVIVNVDYVDIIGQPVLSAFVSGGGGGGGDYSFPIGSSG